MWKNIRKSGALALLCVAAPVVSAATLDVSWQLPTRNTDNTTIPASGTGALLLTEVQYGTCSGTAFGTRIGEVVVPYPGTTAQITGLPYRTAHCVRARVQNNLTEYSSLSNVVSQTTGSLIPGAPTMVANTTVVWEYKNQKFWRRVTEVGSIALGTECGPTSYVVGGNKYYEVDRSDVTLSKTTAKVLVTRCSAA